MTYKYESQLQAVVIEKIKKEYGDNAWVFKTKDECRVGIPDILLCFFGHFVAIELKRPPQKRVTPTGKRSPGRDALKIGEIDPEKLKAQRDTDVTDMQRYNIKKINQAQGSAFVGRSTVLIMEKLEKIMNHLQYSQ